MRLFVTVAVVVALDQLSKFYITSTLEIGQRLIVIDNFLYITYVRNPGAAFGVLPYQTAFLIAITVIVAALVLYFYRTLSEDHRWFRVGLALQLGGALGNLIDRVGGGYVVDFIDFTVWPPVFNLADAAIVIGIGVFIIAFSRDPDLKGERSKSDVS